MDRTLQNNARKTTYKSQKSSPAPARQETRQKARKTSWFAKGMLAYVLVLLVLIALVLYGLWNILEQYEKTTPRAALDAYFSNLSSQNYGTILKESGFTADEMNSEEDYIALLHSLFGEQPGRLTYRPMDSSSLAEGKLYAVYEGEEQLGELVLIPDQSNRYGYTVRANYDYQTPYTITAPGHVQVTVNGIVLAQDGPNAQITPLPTFESLPDASQIPYTVQYQTEPSLAVPEFAATAGGLPCALAEDPAQPHHLRAEAVLSDEQLAEYSQLIENVSKVHANYVSEDASFGTLSGYLYPGTPFYERMATFYAGWYADHESFNFRDLEISNITSTSETTFTGDISFIYEIQQGTVLHEFPSAYHLSFAQYNGEWRLLDLQIK